MSEVTLYRAIESRRGDAETAQEENTLKVLDFSSDTSILGDT